MWAHNSSTFRRPGHTDARDTVLYQRGGQTLPVEFHGVWMFHWSSLLHGRCERCEWKPEELIREWKPQFTMKRSFEVCDIYFYNLESVFTHCCVLLPLKMTVNMIMHPPWIWVSPTSCLIFLDTMIIQAKWHIPVPFCWMRAIAWHGDTL